MLIREIQLHKVFDSIIWARPTWIFGGIIIAVVRVWHFKVFKCHTYYSLRKSQADAQWLKWGQKLITYPENCHNKSWFPSHCPFSSNLLHGQILQKISVQQSGSKDAGFEGGLFQKVFKGYIFCFLGHSVGWYVLIYMSVKQIWRKSTMWDCCTKVRPWAR